MANEKSPFRNIPPFIPRISSAEGSNPSSSLIDPTQVDIPAQFFPYNRNIHLEDDTSNPILSFHFPVAPRVLTRGAQKALGLPLESKTVAAEVEMTVEDLELTMPDPEYPINEIFNKIRADNPDLMITEASNLFRSEYGRPPSPPNSSSPSHSDSSGSESSDS